MPTPFIIDPYRVLAAYALGVPEVQLQGGDVLAVQDRAEEAIASSQSPGGLIFNFLKRYPSIERGDSTQAEKLLRFFLRRDHYLLSKEVTPGAYRHFKGSLYTVEGLAKLLLGPSEALAVCYFSPENEKQLFVRPHREWTHIVQWPDGEYRLRFMPLKG